MRWTGLIAATMLAGAAPNAVGAQALPAPQQQHQAIEGGVPLTPENRAHVQRAAAEVLFWNQEQRDQNFPHMEKLFPGRPCRSPRRRSMPLSRRRMSPG